MYGVINLNPLARNFVVGPIRPRHINIVPPHAIHCVSRNSNITNVEEICLVQKHAHSATDGISFLRQSSLKRKSLLLVLLLLVGLLMLLYLLWLLPSGRAGGGNDELLDFKRIWILGAGGSDDWRHFSGRSRGWKSLAEARLARFRSRVR